MLRCSPFPFIYCVHISAECAKEMVSKTGRALAQILVLVPNFTPCVLHHHTLTVKTNNILKNASSELQLLQRKATFFFFFNITLFVLEGISERQMMVTQTWVFGRCFLENKLTKEITDSHCYQ